jgi:proteic killer suppression protein
MIRSYRDRNTQRLADRERVKRFQAIQQPAREKLRILDTAQSLQDLSLPGLRLEKLKGNRAGQYSIRVNDQYRICFRWKDDGPYHVELTDYH